MVFLDIVFTDLPRAPTPGTEVWTGGMGSSPGGIANLAVATARLGLRTTLAAGFGDDGYADWCRRVLADQEGVDLSLSRTFEHWHTPVTVSMAYDGDRAMVTHGHPNPVGPAEMIGIAPRTRAVIVELEDEPWWLPARAAGALVFADVGWDPSGVWDRRVLDQLNGCHCFMPNEVEAQAYTRTATPEAALAALADRVPLAVVTGGVRGAMAVDGSTGERASVPSVPVTAIDPTGAGDVFGASLVVGTLAGWPLEHRLRFSALCASLAVQQFGGALAAPGWGDLADWWSTLTAAATAGDPRARSLRDDYGFLPDVLPSEPAKAMRRAEATIARLSDLDQRRSDAHHD
ncbi:carbohydrate kinase family protein [Pengzhenrongella frigida]|uniref:Carbohydrate kinase family protein n=2 Tax=Pengzhenrongella frigida TaxID=1259133 RepID=A0A4Q5N466_9MICO|nr:PfkB family carbohydrate kinase [Cellulomonas sp. HLT2-17]RYV53052.1 carbohydrate kinase family protein [Cellulomonas sp. HLT2-17]